MSQFGELPDWFGQKLFKNAKIATKIMKIWLFCEIQSGNAQKNEKQKKNYMGFLMHKIWQILKHFSRALS